MLTRINRIKNLGLVFQDYSVGAGLREFKQANLIYGWNGTGKTTLTRLFDVLESDDKLGVNYDVTIDEVRISQNDVFPKKVRVFNQDFVDRNLRIIEGQANKISILVGKQNQDLLDEIERQTIVLNGDSSDSEKVGIRKSLQLVTKAKTNKEQVRQAKFTEIAKTIGIAVGGNALRDYKKPQAETDFKQIVDTEQLSTDELESAVARAQQTVLPSVALLKIPDMKSLDGDRTDFSGALNEYQNEAERVASKTVKIAVIERLKEHADISQWIEHGIKLHADHNSDMCEYCGNSISESRIAKLADHFNDADQKLKKEVDDAVYHFQEVYSSLSGLNTSDPARFYSSLQEDVELASQELEEAKEEILGSVQVFAVELKKKKEFTTESLSLANRISTARLEQAIKKYNDLVEAHGKITNDIGPIQEAAKRQIKDHYLNGIKAAVDELVEQVAALTIEEARLTVEIRNAEKIISTAQKDISSDHQACDLLNDKLVNFLGHQELKFVPQTEQITDESGDTSEVVTAYNIQRGASRAVKLSEGEKTAIGFVYFVIHLSDQDFDKSDGIIVIDDPISSLDSNSLYQAFSFMKNTVKDCHQFFLFTHNFDFLKLVINWKKSEDRDRRKTSYFMINNEIVDSKRVANIDDMDKELWLHESEYHYLFKLLKQLRDTQDGSIAAAYPIPNIARKVWDTFTLFNVPDNRTQYKKIEHLKSEGYDGDKLDSIYKFINDQSHITGAGFDPSLVVGTKRAVIDMLTMMNEISPKHFDILDAATTDAG